MVKQHLKRITIPNTWPLTRKEITFISRPKPGRHAFATGMPIAVFIRDVMGVARTSKEVKLILHNQEVLVDGIRVKDHRFIVGFMDVLAVPGEGSFRIALDALGKLKPVISKDPNVKVCKIIGKSLVKGKTQLNLNDGRNLLVEKDTYKVGGSVLIELPTQKLKEYIALDKGVQVILTSGKHIGKVGVVENIEGRNITLTLTTGDAVQTRKAYAFVVGKDKPLVALSEK